MAPVRTPGRKKRDADYSGIGRYGRKTGVTVPDLGPRDEFGLEPVDNLFSSPHKGESPPSANGNSMEADDMELASSTQREPSDLLASVRQGPKSLVTSRSPVKASLGSSPRRSTGVFLSPNRSSRYTPRTSLARHSMSARSTRQVLGARGSEAGEAPSTSFHEQSLRSSARQFDLMHSDSDEDIAHSQASHEEAREPELDSTTSPVRGDGFYRVHTDDVNAHHLRRDSESNTGVEATVTEHNSRAGRKRKSNEISLENDATLGDSDDRPQGKTKRGRPPKRGGLDELPHTNGKTSKVARSLAVIPASSSSKHAPRKRGHRNLHLESSEMQIGPESERNTADATTVAKKGFVSRAQTKTSSKSEPNGEPSIASPVVLRSGRRSVKPLAFWRGEQIVYEAPQRVGQDLLPGGYIGVNPGRLVNEIKPKQAPRRGRKKVSKLRDNAGVSDEEQDRDEWEIDGDDPGVLHADVYIWDPDTQSRVEEAHEKIELALAPSALNDRTQWAKGRTFKFGKTLTLPFFHSGVVDLPPGGEKRPKNSRKNHMIFWVFSGRVRVDVSGNVFNVSRGGMWQVPRGNSYGLSNPFERDVRIFFAQGSYMEQPEDETELMSGAALAES